jgi:signal transduction histidine kinase
MSLSTKPIKNDKFESSFTPEMLEAQQQSLSKVSRFPMMRFEAQLEAAFEEFRYFRLIKRVPIVGITGLVLFLVFSILDLYSLPEAVYQVSIPIRLLLICPSIILIIYLAIKVVSADIFIRVYFGAYLIAGGAIITIIYTAAMHDHLLPYDGILLQLVFGYFLMSLPYMLALYGGLLISVVYLFMSTHMNLPMEQLASNAIFIISINFIGAIGCYMQERARRFLFLNEKLVALSKEKDKKEIASKTRLVATASHDLRQPLHAMHLLIETLDDQLPDGEQKGIVKSLDISIKQLSQLLNTLLDISKLNAGIVEPKLESINLAEKISTFCQDQSLRLKESNLSLAYEGNDSVFVRIDPLLFDRIIRNILENIFVHAEATKVSFSWKSKNNKVHLEVVDNGKGIAEEDIKTIFEEFQQSGDNVRAGMGLGLTIVKQLAELQGIEYGLNSSAGKGACFWFNMALAENQGKLLVGPLAKVTIIKRISSNYAEAWADQIKAWGYGMSLLPLGFNMTTNHIRRVLSKEPQILIWDAGDEEDINKMFDQLQTLQADFVYSLPVLIVTDTEIKQKPDLESLIFEVVSPSIRPGKLRLIVEHLAGEI